jgi:hypothetical protein
MLDCTYQSGVNGLDYDKAPTKYKEKSMANGDKLRSMTDEELADELFDLFAAFYDVEWSKEVLLDWLKQEADDGASAE